MRHLFIIPSIWLAIVASAHALSIELPVTPNNLDQNNYTFTVSSSTTNNQVAFHVSITGKKEDIASSSNVGVAIVTHTKDSQGATSGTSIAAYAPEIPIAVKKD
jgi:hypothetical protein